MALDFPSNPTNGQLFQDYFWDAATGAWRGIGSANNLGVQVADLQAGTKKIASYASAAARGSAIGTAVSEGMVSYLQDTNQVEVYDGSSWLGLGPSGRILQIQSSLYTTETATTSASYVDTGLSVTITPTSASSKLLVFVTQVAGHGPGDAVYNLRLVRDSTALGTMMALGLLNEPSNYLRRSHSLNAVVTSGSTSATTFKTQIMRNSGTVQVITQPDVIAGSIIAIEVSA